MQNKKVLAFDWLVGLVDLDFMKQSLFSSETYESRTTTCMTPFDFYGQFYWSLSANLFSFTMIYAILMLAARATSVRKEVVVQVRHRCLHASGRSILAASPSSARSEAHVLPHSMHIRTRILCLASNCGASVVLQATGSAQLLSHRSNALSILLGATPAAAGPRQPCSRGCARFGGFAQVARQAHSTSRREDYADAVPCRQGRYRAPGNIRRRVLRPGPWALRDNG